DVFEEFGALEIANTARLAGRIELMSESIGSAVKTMIIPGLVDAHTPEDDAGMIPVAPDHPGQIVDGEELPVFVADVLPTGDFFEDEQAKFVARVQEVPRLRIVRSANDIAFQLSAEDLRIAALNAGRHGLSDERESLVAIEAAQLEQLSVQLEAMIGEASFTKANSPRIAVH